MNAKSNTMKAFFAAGAAAAMCASSPALAVDAGQCLPIDQFNTAMKAEGQRTLIIGNRVAVNDTTKTASGVEANRFMNAISANEDGSLGYQFEGNRPRGEPSTEVCVAAKLTNVRLYDARRASIPAAAYLGGSFNKIVDTNASVGTRPMVVADTVFGTGTNVRNGRPIVMFGNVERQSGSLSTLLANGDPAMLVFTMETEYTPNALQRLGDTRVATLSPALGGGNR